jgi:hypothetical protein
VVDRGENNGAVGNMGSPGISRNSSESGSAHGSSATISRHQESNNNCNNNNSNANNGVKPAGSNDGYCYSCKIEHRE